MEINPFVSYIKKLFNLRFEYTKQKSKVGDNLIKSLMNSLYGKTVQKDIKTESHLWNEATLKKIIIEDLFVSCDKINEDQWYVEMKKLMKK